MRKLVQHQPPKPWRRARRPRGATATEYVLVLMLIAIAGIIGLELFGAPRRNKVNHGTPRLDAKR